MARRQPRNTGTLPGSLATVGTVAVVAVVVHVAALWVLDGAVPSAYDFGQIIGTHLVAFLITGLVASLTRLGSFGATVAVYVLSFGALQLLLAITDIL